MARYKPRENFPVISPYLNLQGIPEFVEFTEKVLGAEITARTNDDNGVLMYATIEFDGSVIMAMEAEGPAYASPATMYFYVENTEEMYQKALDAGCTSLAEPALHYHGDKNAGVQDKWGNQWWFATNVDFPDDEEVAKRKSRQNA